MHPVDREAVALQAGADGLTDHAIVFYQQQSHDAQSMINLS
jgi:hypothetical protein